MVGISHQVDDNQLETKVLSIFEKIGCTIDPDFIDDCHRLDKNNDRVMINFSRRKDCKECFKSKKTDDLDDLDLPRGTKMFVNQSLCPYYRISDYIV